MASVSRTFLLALACVCVTSSGSAQTRRADRDFWNAIFAKGTDFQKTPSQLLIRTVEGRKPGTALDLGMGQGRNALYLARLGWQVTGVDLSDKAVGQAKADAARLGTRLDARVADLDRFDLGRGRWDLVLLLYMHGYLHDSRRDYPKLLWDALKPGGILVIEGFAGGDTGFETNELLRKYTLFTVRYYEDTVAESDWSPGQKVRVIRMVAEKAGA